MINQTRNKQANQASDQKRRVAIKVGSSAFLVLLVLLLAAPAVLAAVLMLAPLALAAVMVLLLLALLLFTGAHKLECLANI